MASSQPDDKGARPKTNLQSNSGHQKNKNERGRAKHDNQSGSDVEKDSVPNSVQGNAPPGFHQPPYLVDVAVIYAKEDYDQVEDKFVPWLKRMAWKTNLVDARIHLYDDPKVSSEANVFSQTKNVTAKCMKIFVFITDNLMEDKILKGVVDEMTFLTRFITEDEAKQHISKISEKLHPVCAKYLSECVQRQKENALIPVQTKDKKINFFGLISIRPILYYDLEKNSRVKEKIAQNCIQGAMEDRTKLQQYFTNTENRDWSSCEHPDSSSWKNNNNVPILDQEKEKKTENNVSRTANTDFISESSNTVEGNGQESSVEPRLEGDEGASESGNSQDEGLGSEHIHQSQVPTSTENSTLETSEETKVSVHGDPAATPATSNGDDTPETDLEEDQLESGRADNTEIKTVCALTESGYDSLSGEEQLQQKGESKPVKDPGETSLDNTGLVNDSGDAALGKDLGDANLKSSKEESMLSTDAQKEERESHLYSTQWKSSIEDQGEVLEPTLTYSKRPEPFSKDLMAGNVFQKDSDRRCPAGSDVSGAKHYNIASNKDIPEQAIAIHNEMVNYLGERIYGDDLIKLKELFRNIPLTPAAMEKIHDIRDLFKHLIVNEIISYGSYTEFVSNLRQINPLMATYMEKKGKEIQEIITCGDLSSFKVNRSWQSEAEDVQGPPLSDDLQPFVIGPQPAVSSLQTTSLFASILSVKQQFHLHSGTLRTNPLGMMTHCS
ncbi:uncharacterized protein LOC110446710, partial [Mizuhopecten yessoensis]|uniref:uncharacterized protein LOC110446710 n=1 Tax=Mizuhopecten yessoensis TaxID=6573 RepID=UPI000B45C97C